MQVENAGGASGAIAWTSVEELCDPYLGGRPSRQTLQTAEPVLTRGSFRKGPPPSATENFARILGLVQLKGTREIKCVANNC